MNKKIIYFCISLVLIMSMMLTGVAVMADEPEAVETAETVVSETPAASVELPEAVFELIAETDKVALYADKTIGEIKFTDKVSGIDWYSNPQDKSSELDIGKAKDLLYSQFTVEYSMAYNPVVTDSAASCLKYTRKASEPTISAKAFNALAGYNEDAGFTEIGLCDSLSHELIDNGIKFIYQMPSIGFKIVIQYKVNNDYLEASVLTDECILKAIKMEKQSVAGSDLYATRITEIDYNVNRINLLPMFGSARKGEDGYMFVPDKSGVIVNYDNGKENYEDYSKPVYGGYYDSKKYAHSEDGVYMPVFGNVKPNGTLMGVISEGEAAGFIDAYISGSATEFNNVYASMQYSVVEKNFGETEGIPYAESYLGDKNFSVRYYSLGADNGGYVGMANKYREYLVNEKGMQPSKMESSPVYLDIYGQVVKDKNILGVPVEMPEDLTTYNQVVEIVSSLGDEGIKPVVKYTNWQDADSDGKVVEKVKLSGYLGSKAEFNEMVDYMTENGIGFYPGIDMTNLAKGSAKYQKFSSSAKLIDQSPITIHIERIPLKLGNKWYLLKPQLLQKGMSAFVNNYKEYEVGGLALDSIATKVYADFTKGSVARAETVGIWEDVFKNAKENVGSVMVDKANAYAFPYADFILTTPSTDAYCEIANYTVPFYQMVVRGYVNYGTEAVNLSATPELIRLKGIETGAALTYSVFESPASDVKGTYMNYLFSSNYDLVKDTIVNYYNADKDFYAKIKGQEIINHEILAEDVTRTTFENGVKVVVNYNNEAVTLDDGTVIEAVNYKVQ